MIWRNTRLDIYSIKQALCHNNLIAFNESYCIREAQICLSATHPAASNPSMSYFLISYTLRAHSPDIYIDNDGAVHSHGMAFIKNEAEFGGLGERLASVLKLTETRHVGG